MKLLFCCEYYHPSRGGVQEVMRQIAERMVRFGHDVTVATTRLDERDFDELNGVRIVDFDIRGNRATGLRGDIAAYVHFLKTFPADAILIKAAQQWTFDACWDALDDIKGRKVFIPCGFSGLYLPEYQSYFQSLPYILSKFDALIFYAERYRDIDYAKAHGLTRLHILPNGASDIEFAVARDAHFRQALGIGEDETLLLTVGSPINAKGHLEVVQAFAMLERPGELMTLILNGQWPEPSMPPKAVPIDENTVSVASMKVEDVVPSRFQRLLSLKDRALKTLAREGWTEFFTRVVLSLYYRTLGLFRFCLRVLFKPFFVARYRIGQWLYIRKLMTNPPEPPPKTIDEWIDEVNALPGKRVLKTNLPRSLVVQAFLNADLFVFASNVEYSPLVLFESCAAGLPYITGSAGNAEEIVRWTGGGVLCPAAKDDFGYTRVDPVVLAKSIEALLADPLQLNALSTAGRKAWRETYNWEAIAHRYLMVLEGKVTSTG